MKNEDEDEPIQHRRNETRRIKPFGIFCANFDP